MRSTEGIGQKAGATWIRAAAIALGCHLVWYGWDAVLGGFRNLDVSGIAYNARLLLSGGLPYVDSFEIKAPGTFFLFAAILAFGSTHAIWAVAILWGAATSLAVGLLAARLWGRRFALPAVALHAGGTLLPTQADVNYSFWATLPMVLAAAMAFKPRDEVARPKLHWFLVGAVAAVAFAMKQSTVGLIVVLPLAVFLCAGERHAERLRASLCGIAGAAAVLVALALPWLLAGEVGALVAGLGFRGGWWIDYASAEVQPTGGPLRAVGRGALFIVETIQIGSAAAILGLIRRAREREHAEGDAPRWGLLAAVVFLLASFAGMAATLRFYLHYLVQIWPAMVVVALHPSGAFVRILDRLAGLGARSSLVCLLLAVGGTLLRIDKVARPRIERALNDAAVVEICDRLEPHLAPGDTVLAWGWPSWGVYTHCGRQAPGPIYKAMTIVTTHNTNTGFRGSDAMVLRPGPAADRYVADFLDQRPALFLWSPGYAKFGYDPLVDLPAITEVLDREYRGVPMRQGYVAFVRQALYERVRPSDPRFDIVVRLEDVMRSWNMPPEPPPVANAH